MKATVKSMKLEVTVKSHGEVLCHDVIEKDNSSPKSYQKAKKTQVQHDKSITDKNADDTIIDIKSFDKESPEKSLFSKDASNLKKVQKVKEILVPNKTSKQNKSDADIKAKEAPKKESFFSKLMCCCRKKKPTQPKQEVLLASEIFTAPEVKVERADEPPLSLEIISASQFNVEAPEVLNSNEGATDNSLGDTVVEKSTEPFKSDEILHPSVVTPLKSSDKTKQSDIEPINQSVDLPTKDYSNDELTLPPMAVDDESSQLMVRPINETIQDNQEADNDGNFITDVYFEAVVSFSSN